MSEIFQFGNGHPDADQLSAFMEHALPEDAREQTLAHLAVCAECREIVTLAGDAVEELPAFEAARPVQSWWAGWRLPVWRLAVPMVTLIAVLLVTLHYRRTGQPSLVPPDEHATVTAPVQPLTPLGESPVPPKPEAAAPPARVREAGPGAPGSVAPRLAPPLAAPKPVVSESQVAGLPSRGRDTETLAQDSVVGNEAVKSPGRVSGNAAGHSAVMGAMAAAPAPAAPKSAMQPSSGNVGVAGGIGSAPSGDLGRIAPVQKAAAANGLSMSSGAAMGSGTGAGVGKQQPAAPALETAAAAPQELFALAAPALDGVVSQHPLPTHLPAISVATNGRGVVAIDVAHHVFVSDDGGEHWNAVATPWAGRAARVSRVSLPVVGGAGRAVDLLGTAKAAGTASSSLTGVLMDATGAAIPGAVVTVSGAVTRSVKSDAAGRYFVAGLPPGTYQLRADMPGFESSSTAVTVGASTQLNENLTLRVGAATETVEVTTDSASMQLATPSKRERRKKEAASVPALPVFELVTESGERWTSVDGRAWTRK